MTEAGKPERSSDRTKLDEDDHDLLTFTEVGERLRREVAAAEREVTRLAALGPTPDLTRAEARLRDLRAAARRNTAQPINDENFERFFGYPGKARRGSGAD
ncbi:acyl-CoA synthetase [Mycobacterium sp. EPG1]|nr:acyl-CoA synthetase [Mycobacterium sp. EPG1]